MIDLEAVGKNIARLREENHFSQTQIAERLFVSRQAVSQWEQGISLPSIDNLIELANIFQRSFEELLCLNAPLTIDPNNPFVGHSRTFVVGEIIAGKINISLPEKFYLFAPSERMMILRAIRQGQMKIDLKLLWPFLSLEERVYLKPEVRTHELLLDR